jgi:hypothetical protein
MWQCSQAFQLHGDLYNYTLSLYFFILFWGRVFFTFQHNLGTLYSVAAS